MKNSVMLVAISLLASSAHSLADTVTANEEKVKTVYRKKSKKRDYTQKHRAR